MKTNEHVEQFITVGTTAARLCVSQLTVRRWIKAGRLDAVRLGRGVRIRASSVERLVASAAAWRADEPTLPAA
jgi:excisionase family DNA binding protein